VPTIEAISSLDNVITAPLKYTNCTIMGRHDDEDNRDSESKEDRLLRKAREFVERETKSRKGGGDKQRSDRKKRSRHDDDRRKRRDDDSAGSSRDERKKRKHARHKDDRKKHSRREDDDDSEEEGRRHRHNSKKYKKKSSKKDRNEKSKKSVKKLKVDKSKLFNLGDVLGREPDRPLDVEMDYFAYHQHLWVYLYREEGIAFGDLTSEDARDAFVRFCDKYNKGKLQSGYYASVLPLAAIEESKTTTHKWAFQTNSTEKESLHLIGKGVRKQTEYESAKAGLPSASAASSKPAAGPELAGRSRMSAEERSAERVANRRLRDHVRTAEDEFTGGRKDPGRERQMEKKKEKAAALHASARDREDMGGGVELGDADLYGGSSNDFAAALARKRQHKSKRETEKEARVAELQQKETDRQAAMLKALGLTGIKPGQKITIAPRKDA
jgi:hypothetical protein